MSRAFFMPFTRISVKKFCCPAITNAAPAHPAVASFVSAPTTTVSRPGDPADADAPRDVSVTIYSRALPGVVPAESCTLGTVDFSPQLRVSGYAFVRDTRAITTSKGRGEVRFADVPASIDPTTVRVQPLDDPDAIRVLSQDFQFDLVSQEKLLHRFIDREITLVLGPDHTDRVTGILLSAGRGPLVLKLADGSIQTFADHRSIRLGELPGGLISRPTLVWNVHSERGGPLSVRVSYQISAITWWADYNACFTPGPDPSRGVLNLSAWVSILNRSGGSFHNATLKLIAGDVHRAPAPRGVFGQHADQVESLMRQKQPDFEQRSFFEYYLYTLSRPASIANNSTTQIELFSSTAHVPVEKIFVYSPLESLHTCSSPALLPRFGAGAPSTVNVYLRCKNDRASGLGVPLPAGRVRVTQLDPADNTEEFIGEDHIYHTPQDEPVLLRLGTAFDVVGDRTQVAFHVDTDQRVMDEQIEISIRNHKNEPVTVIVRERFCRYAQSTLTDHSVPAQRINYNTVHFTITVAAGAAASVSYTVRYQW